MTALNHDYKSQMLKTLPLYYRNSKVLHQIFSTFQSEIVSLDTKILDLELNMFVDTAKDALSIQERDLGIKSISSLNDDQRREQIYSRNRASFDQTTEETIKAVSSAYSNGEVDIKKTATPGVFEVRFVGTIGIPNNMNGLKAALDIIIPAHLELNYVFTYLTWADWERNTWADLEDKSWNQLKEGE